MQLEFIGVLTFIEKQFKKFKAILQSDDSQANKAKPSENLSTHKKIY